MLTIELVNAQKAVPCFLLFLLFFSRNIIDKRLCVCYYNVIEAHAMFEEGFL